MNLGAFQNVYGVDITPSLISIYSGDQELMIPYSGQPRLFNSFLPDRLPTIKAWELLHHIQPTGVTEIAATPTNLTIYTEEGTLSWQLMPRKTAPSGHTGAERTPTANYPRLNASRP